MARLLPSLGLFCALVALAGCGGGKLTEVEGSVTVDGKDLPEGEILFIPEDKTQGTEAGKIKDGKYRLKAKTGKMKVQIRATEEVPGKKSPTGTEALIVDLEYIDDGTLVADVGPGKTKFDFKLKRKK